MRLHFLFLFFIFSFSFFPSFSQSNQNLPLTREKNLLYEEYFSDSDFKVHTSIKPFTNSKELEVISDSINKSVFLTSDKEKKYLNKISADGIFNSEFIYETGTTSADNNTLEGGVVLNGYISNKLSFNATFLSGNSSFTSYLDSFIIKTNVSNKTQFRMFKFY